MSARFNPLGVWVRHPVAKLTGVIDDELTPEILEQLARSVLMSGVLGDRDRHLVADALRQLASMRSVDRPSEHRMR